MFAILAAAVLATFTVPPGQQLTYTLISGQNLTASSSAAMHSLPAGYLIVEYAMNGTAQGNLALTVSPTTGLGVPLASQTDNEGGSTTSDVFTFPTFTGGGVNVAWVPGSSIDFFNAVTITIIDVQPFSADGGTSTGFPVADTIGRTKASIQLDAGFNIDIHAPAGDGGVVIWGDPDPSHFNAAFTVLGSTYPFTVDSQGNAHSEDAYAQFLGFETTSGVDFTSEPAAFGQFPAVFGVSLGSLMLGGNQSGSATHNVEVSTNGYTQSAGYLFEVCNGAPAQGRCPSPSTDAFSIDVSGNGTFGGQLVAPIVQATSYIAAAILYNIGDIDSNAASTIALKYNGVEEAAITSTGLTATAARDPVAPVAFWDGGSATGLRFYTAEGWVSTLGAASEFFHDGGVGGGVVFASTPGCNCTCSIGATAAQVKCIGTTQAVTVTDQVAGCTTAFYSCTGPY